MNIWQRFKNWLINKMGGYTEEKLKRAYNDGVTESNKTHENTIKSMRYWFNKYYEEHTAYLALLNCHNATVEAMQNVAIAADTIKDYCANREDCDGCPLHGECGCKTADKACPEYWD